MRLPDVTELFLSELQSRGVDQTWYCGPSKTPGGLRLVKVGDATIIVPPSVDGLAGKLATRLMSLFFETFYLIKQFWWKPDAILIRDKYWGAVVGYLVARACGIPFLVWLSYPYPQHDTEEAARTKGVKRYLRIARAWGGSRMLYPVMRRADRCFVQSEQMRTDLQVGAFIPRERMTAVPMGVPRRMAHEEAIATPSYPPTVVYLGKMAAVRRLEVIVDAFALAAQARPDVRFTFVGDGDTSSDLPRLQARVKLAGISDRVDFTGQLPQVEALKLVRQASVCVSPFMKTPVLRVASPTKLVEYMALGKATVANEHPEHSMIAMQSKALVICEWSAADFAAHIVYLLDRPEEAGRMGALGRQWVQQNRTYDRLAEMVHRELESALAPTPASTAPTRLGRLLRSTRHQVKSRRKV